MLIAVLRYEGDKSTWDAARAEINRRYRHAEQNGAQLAEQLEHGKAVAKMLRRNLIQGQKQENGRYSIALTPNGSKKLTFKLELNIHQETELGRNDTVKLKTNLKDKPFVKTA